MGLLGHIKSLLEVVTFLLQNMNDIDDLPIAADLIIKSFEVHMNTIENKSVLPSNEGKNHVEKLLRVVTFLVEMVQPLENFNIDMILKYFNFHKDDVDLCLKSISIAEQGNHIDEKSCHNTINCEEVKKEGDPYMEHKNDQDFSEIENPEIITSKAVDLAEIDQSTFFSHSARIKSQFNEEDKTKVKTLNNHNTEPTNIEEIDKNSIDKSAIIDFGKIFL